MSAVTLKEGEDFDCSGTYKLVVNYLPSYARPRFIRIQVMQLFFFLNQFLSAWELIRIISM